MHYSRATQTPSTPPNPPQNIDPPEVQLFAQTESAHRDSAASPLPQSMQNPRTSTPPAPRDSDPPKTRAHRHAGAHRRARRRSRRRPETLPSALSIVGENP